MCDVSFVGRRRETARDQDGGRGRGGWHGRLLVVERGRVSGEHRRVFSPPVSRLPGVLLCRKRSKGAVTLVLLVCFQAHPFGVRSVDGLHAPAPVLSRGRAMHHADFRVGLPLSAMEHSLPRDHPFFLSKEETRGVTAPKRTALFDDRFRSLLLAANRCPVFRKTTAQQKSTGGTHTNA